MGQGQSFWLATDPPTPHRVGGGVACCGWSLSQKSPISNINVEKTSWT